MYCSNLPDKVQICQVAVKVIIICSIWSRLSFIQRWSFGNYGLLKLAGVGWGLRKKTVHVLISFSFQMVIVNVCCVKLINWEIIMNFRIKYSYNVGKYQFNDGAGWRILFIEVTTCSTMIFTILSSQASSA